jgi:DNA replication protein DnaC
MPKFTIRTTPSGTPEPAPPGESAVLGDSQALRAQLGKLGLHTVAERFEAEADRAAKSESSYTAYLARLVEAELASKADRSVNARIARARFPMLRTLDQFDFAFQPSLSAPRVRELFSLGFLEQAANVLLVGGPGVGKSHLAIALGLRVCQARRGVRFFHAPDLLDQLLAADASHRLGALLRELGRVDLLIIDELGYLPMDSRRANLFFQLVAARYTKGAVVITTNVSFDSWGKIFGDEVIAAAILDRLLHYSHPFAINGPSYRVKDKLSATPRPPTEAS